LIYDGQKSNYTYSQPDALIAATAIVHDLAVVTRNVDDFVRAGITVVNPWKT
jgi:predicted nucleic acid-binding protein